MWCKSGFKIRLCRTEVSSFAERVILLPLRLFCEETSWCANRTTSNRHVCQSMSPALGRTGLL